MTAPPTPLSLAGVTQESLAQTGIALDSAPTGPAIAQNEAVSTALAGYPGTQLREVVLVHAYKKFQLPAEGSLCWVVSITPPMATVSGPPGSREIPVRYFLVFVDATTGKFLFSSDYASLDP